MKSERWEEEKEEWGGKEKKREKKGMEDLSCCIKLYVT